MYQNKKHPKEFNRQDILNLENRVVGLSKNIDFLSRGERLFSFSSAAGGCFSLLHLKETVLEVKANRDLPDGAENLDNAFSSGLLTLFFMAFAVISYTDKKMFSEKIRALKSEKDLIKNDLKYSK